MLLERTASMKRATRNAKEKIPVALISPNEMRVVSQAHRNIGGSNKCAGWQTLRPALRGAVFDGPQPLGAAAPAAVLGFLEGERFFDREAVADRNVFPAVGGRRLWLPCPQIPARARAV